MDASTSPAEGPVPSDDGAEDHLRGAVVSPLVLPATSLRRAHHLDRQPSPYGARVKIGVLALQGDFALHARALRRCGTTARESAIEVREVRKPEELEGLDGLIIPGGESTTLLKLMDEWRFVPALEKFHGARKPIFGTCAGLILLARDVESPRQFSLGFIDVTVERNAYGRQRESFAAQGVAHLGAAPHPLEMVFIRAPRIRQLGAAVQTLARHGDEAVMAREGPVLVATFHPELTDDLSVHQYFCRMVADAVREP